MNKFKIYISYFKIKFNNAIQYKIAAIAGVLTQLAYGAMYIMLYTAFLKNGSSSDLSIAQMSTYIWLQQGLYMMYTIWSVDKEILEEIKTGNISMELIRPIDLYDIWHSKTLAKKMAITILRFIPILLLCTLLPIGDYRLMLPVNFTSFTLFLITFILSIALTMAYIMMMYVTVMYTVDSNGVKVAFQMMCEFCSGGVIPISFMPAVLEEVLKFTPFYYMQNMPLNIYNGYFNDYKEITIRYNYAINMDIFAYDIRKIYNE